MKTRMKPDVRRAQAVTAGLSIAENEGLASASLSAVAVDVGVSRALLTYHFKTAGEFSAAVVRGAIDSKNFRVLAQAIVAGHPATTGLDSSLRGAALASLR